MEFRLEVNQYFSLLAIGIESVAHGSVLFSRVFCKRHFRCSEFLHVGSTLHKCFNVKTGTSNGQQTYRCEHRETAAYIVGNDKALIAFLVSGHACSTLLGISNSHNHLACHFNAALLLALLAQQAESQSSLGSSTTLRDVDHAKFATLQVGCQLVKIVLANIVTSKEHDGIFAIIGKPFKAVAECFDHGTCTQVATADTGHYNGVAVFTQHLGSLFQVCQMFGCD